MERVQLIIDNTGMSGLITHVDESELERKLENCVVILTATVPVKRA